MRTGWTLVPLPLLPWTLITIFSRLGTRCISLAKYQSHGCALADRKGDEGTPALLGPPSEVELCIVNCDSVPQMSPYGSCGFTGVTLSIDVQHSMLSCINKFYSGTGGFQNFAAGGSVLLFNINCALQAHQ